MPKIYYERAKDVNVGSIILNINNDFKPFDSPTVYDLDDVNKTPYGYKELSQLFYTNKILLLVGENNTLVRPSSISESTGTDPNSGKEVEYCSIYYTYDGSENIVTSYDTYIEEPFITTDVEIASDLDLFGKFVNDLQDNITIENNKIIGTLKYVSDYTGFSSDVSLQSGNYLAIHNTSNFSDPIYVELLNGISGPVQLDPDGIIVLKIADKNTQIVRVTSGDLTYDYVLTDLVIEEAQ